MKCSLQSEYLLWFHGLSIQDVFSICKIQTIDITMLLFSFLISSTNIEYTAFLRFRPVNRREFEFSSWSADLVPSFRFVISRRNCSHKRITCGEWKNVKSGSQMSYKPSIVSCIFRFDSLAIVVIVISCSAEIGSLIHGTEIAIL